LIAPKQGFVESEWHAHVFPWNTFIFMISMGVGRQP
jgi:hypothetical protein